MKAGWFPIKRVLKEQNGMNQALTFRGVPMKGVLKAASTTNPGSMG
jgi:hypothetical protein